MALRDRPLKLTVIHIVLIVYAFLSLYPILRVVTISLRPGDRAFSASLSIIPEDATLEAYRHILFEKGYSGGKAKTGETVLKEIKEEKDRAALKEGVRNFIKYKSYSVYDNDKEKAEELEGTEKENYETYKNYKQYSRYEKYLNYIEADEQIIDKKIGELHNLQNKLWYKFLNASFFTWFKNSMIVSFFTVAFGVSFAATAGYAFSRFNFPGKQHGMIFFLITQMFPPTMLLLPMYLVMSRLNLTNTYFGLILMYTTTALPLCVWQMKGYYDTIPYTLEEAALIDGCSPFQAFYQIILPLVKPGVVVTALFSFMASWTDYIVANVIMQREELKTLPLGLQSMNGRYKVEWANFSASSILVMIPAMILFMYLSKYLVSGLTLGGVKE